MTPTPKIAIAAAYSSRGNTSNSVACAVESSAPPPRPWMMRQVTISASVCALPQKTEATVKRAIEKAK
jgi:hypothetical protein